MKATSFKMLFAAHSLALCLIVLVGQIGAQQPPGAQTAPAPQASIVIPLAEVATRVTEVSNLLRTLQTQFAPNPENEKIQKELPDVRDRLEAKLRRTMKLLQAQPTMEMLQTEEQVWQKSQAEMSKWMSVLTQRATQRQAADMAFPLSQREVRLLYDGKP